MTAAFALQARLYAIAVENLLRSDDPSEVRAEPEEQGYVYTSTLWMIGRYLAWVELLRRDRYFLALGTTHRGRELLAAVAAVEFAFADTRLDPRLRLFRAHQSAIAELMIVERESRGEVRSDSLGYATFTSKLEDENDLVFRRWFATLMGGLQELASSPGTSRRATELQHALLDLVGFLDEAGAASSYPRAPK